MNWIKWLILLAGIFGIISGIFGMSGYTYDSRIEVIPDYTNENRIWAILFGISMLILYFGMHKRNIYAWYFFLVAVIINGIYCIYSLITKFDFGTSTVVPGIGWLLFIFLCSVCVLVSWVIISYLLEHKRKFE